MKKALYLTMILIFIAVLGWAQSVAFAQVVTKVSFGSFTYGNTQTPTSMVVVGISAERVNLELGFAEGQTALFFSIAPNLYFAGILAQQTTVFPPLTLANLAIVGGVHFENALGFIRIGYLYPLIGSIEPGLFVDLALQIDVTSMLQTAVRDFSE